MVYYEGKEISQASHSFGGNWWLLQELTCVDAVRFRDHVDRVNGKKPDS